MHLIRFRDIVNPTATNTVDIQQVRAIGMLLGADGVTYMIRLSFGDSATLVVKEGLTLVQATALRNLLEKQWSGSDTAFGVSDVDQVHVID